MDGFVFVFLPIVAEAALPFVALGLLLPRITRLLQVRSKIKQKQQAHDTYLADLETYAGKAHQLICDLILDANSSTSPVALPPAREQALFELQQHLPSTFKN